MAAARTAPDSPPRHTWRAELQDLMRGIGGAAIVGIPLVYTMEMWQLATLLQPRTVLLLILLGIAVNIGYNYVSGFRKDSGLLDAVLDAVEAYGLAALFALALLFLLGIVDGGTPLIDIASKTAVEALPLSIGVSVANTQFAGSRLGGERATDSSKGLERRHPFLVDAGVTVAGAIIFAFNIAPTEEVMLLATRASGMHLLALIVFSLALSYGMIFVAEFTGLERRLKSEGLLQKPVAETLVAYLLALGIALGMIYLFHPLTVSDSPYTTAAATVVLGLPATIGGAAGRLIV